MKDYSADKQHFNSEGFAIGRMGMGRYMRFEDPHAFEALVRYTNFMNRNEERNCIGVSSHLARHVYNKKMAMCSFAWNREARSACQLHRESSKSLEPVSAWRLRP